jgi:stage IV sporulation protein B
MPSKNRRTATGLVLALVVLAVAASPSFRSVTHLPREMRLLLGEEQRLAVLGLPMPAVIRSDHEALLRINGATAGIGGWRVNLATPLTLKPVAAGHCSLDLTLFGLITLRHVAVEVVSRPVITPGGQSVGILLRTAGVAVVGHAPVETTDGQVRYPAREAGVRVGDIILKVDGIAAKSSQHVIFLVNRCAREGRVAALDVNRGGQTVRIEVGPVFGARERVFQLGLFVRDGAAGVGTLTFYEPTSQVFMALGHVISDSVTNQPLQISDGRVVRATVAGVRPGKRGEPGEKEGTFVQDQDIVGSITANTEFGLVGLVTAESLLLLDAREPASEGRPTGLPVALAREVSLGPAEILTVVSGTRVEAFDVEILRVAPGYGTPTPKGITLRVVDPTLLEATGGIVQGMSGSPIIQNGRLVGAVTHVFVNDPTRGYGVFAEWMVREAGLLREGEEGTVNPGAFSLQDFQEARTAVCCEPQRMSNAAF